MLGEKEEIGGSAKHKFVTILIDSGKSEMGGYRQSCIESASLSLTIRLYIWDFSMVLAWNGGVFGNGVS